MSKTKGSQSSAIKITGIVGSPHKHGMTAQLVQQALAGAQEAGAETTLVFLVDEPIGPCIGCNGNCWETHECVHDPASASRNASLQDSDGLIMAVPVYCWQMNGLTQLFIDKMRWNTGSVLEHLNMRAAFGIACAGGSGTGCIMALQALYRYFYNWAFHGIKPLPVTRFNFHRALDEARIGGETLVNMIRQGLKPYPSLGSALSDLEALPYMSDGPVDELRFIVQQLCEGIDKASSVDAQTFYDQYTHAQEAFSIGDRKLAVMRLGKAYEIGVQLWKGKVLE
jgi:NAD(P)H-dependent FMN reductase